VGFVYARANGIEKSRPEGLLVSDGIGFVFFQHIPTPDREEERMGSGREDKYAVRSAQMSGVDSRWREVCDPKPDTGRSSARKAVGNG